MSGANSQGVQLLLAAEKKAAEVVKQARNRESRPASSLLASSSSSRVGKAQRLKAAKDEADAEIKKFTDECERKFKLQASSVSPNVSSCP